MQIFKLDVQDRVFVPVFVIEVPPLMLVDGEALGFHGAAKQIAVPALERSAAGIIRERSRRHFIVRARHLDGLARGEIVEREIDSAAAIVARTLRWIGDEDFAFGRSGVPENFGDVPGTIGVMNQQAVPERPKFVEGADKSFGGRSLQKRASLRVDRRTKKIVRGGVTDVEMDSGIKSSQFDELRLAKVAVFVGRR